MKSFVLTLMGGLPLLAIAQQPVFVNKATQAVKIGTISYETGAPVNHDPLVRGHVRDIGTGTIIGHTTYDLQSNSADPQRVVRLANGNVAVTWTGAVDPNLNPPDRGTFYQFYDGTNWLPEPTVRIEHVRTGWPSNVIVNGKELIYAHDPAVSKMVRMSRNSIGSGTWNVETNTGMNGTWPRVASNGSDDIAHIIFANYVGTTGNAFMLYNRTPDAGASLDKLHVRLPGIDTASGYTIMAGDAYAIAARGTRVAIVAGGMVNDLAVWISDNQGDTWTRYRVIDFPIDNFTGAVLTDTNNDGTADTLWTNDAGHSINIDLSGKVHLWTGRMRVLDETVGDSSWSYFPGTNGLYYWNEDMGEDSIVVLTGVLDLNGSGDLDGIGASIPLYEVSLSGMPTSAVDASGRISLVYAAMVEFSDYLGDPSDPAAQSFRDLYGMYSDDGGDSWSEPINLTNSALLFKENVYPTAARDGDGFVHVQWQRDEEPGTAYGSQPDPPVENEIMYHEWESPFVSAVPEPAQLEGVSIYPNPAAGPLALEFEEAISGSVQVSVFDIMGREVMSQSVKNVSGSSGVIIETSKLANGTYTIRVSSERGVMSAQVEILK